jgi:hypothetical protein
LAAAGGKPGRNSGAKSKLMMASPLRPVFARNDLRHLGPPRIGCGAGFS